MPRNGGYRLTKRADARVEEENSFGGQTSVASGSVETDFRLSPGVLSEIRHFGDQTALYGMGGVGERLEISGRSAVMRHRAQYGDMTYLYIPLVLTGKGQLWYVNAATGDNMEASAHQSGMVRYSTNSGIIDSWNFQEQNIRETVRRWYGFSGSQSLLPRWAYGYIQSRYGYRNNQEVYDVVMGFEERDIPLSGLVLDLYWFDEMGDLDWNRFRWQPEELSAFLRERDIRLLAISEPYITSWSANWEPFQEAGLLGQDSLGNTVRWESWWSFSAPDGGMIDVLADNALEHIGPFYRAMHQSGIDAFWTDLGEPEELPPEIILGDLPGEDVALIYNREWNRLIIDSMAESYPDWRPFILSRSGYTGSSGLGVSIWTGDVNSRFQSLARHPAMGLGAALTGFPWWGFDVGGFTRELTPEAFIRWHQLALFSPQYRAHASQRAQEPWIFGGSNEALISDIIRQRHELLSYIYSSAWQTWQDGIPLMRPLFLEFPEEDWTWMEDKSWMFGDWFYVSPITRPLGTLEPHTYRLPQGRWLDWWTGETVEGGQTFQVSPEHPSLVRAVEQGTDLLEWFPVYLREGAIVPLERENRKILVLFPPEDGESSWVWFDDDGISNNYLAGAYTATGILLRADSVEIRDWPWSGDLEIQILSGDGSVNTMNVSWEPGSHRIDF